MVGVNKVILIGNLGKNPDVVAFPQDRNNETSSVVKKASFPLATTEYRRTKDGERVEQTEWHNVVCWRALAEIAEKILRKGTQLYVEGKLKAIRGTSPRWWLTTSRCLLTGTVPTIRPSVNKTLSRLYLTARRNRWETFLSSRIMKGSSAIWHSTLVVI